MKKEQLTSTQYSIGAGVLVALIVWFAFSASLIETAYFGGLAGAIVGVAMAMKKPKYERKLINSFLGLWVAIGVVGAAYLFLVDNRTNLDLGTADTADMISALQIFNEGQQAVLFDDAGKKVPSPNYETGKTDRFLVWRPDGNRLFFTSDRKEAAYNVYRWNPGSNSVDQQSTGSLSRFDPNFPKVADPTNGKEMSDAIKAPLLVQGGLVLEFDIKSLTTKQVLPPKMGVTVGAEEGSGGTSQFDALYQKFGTSFRTAVWAKGKTYVAAVIKRDEGEVLIAQKRTPTEDKDLIPRPIIAAEHIDLDVDPVSGSVIITVLNYQFIDPENPGEANIKNGKSVKPINHGVFMFDPTLPSQEAMKPIAFSKEEQHAFGPVSVSPDGSQILLTAGTWDGTSYTPRGLVTMPLQPNGMMSGSEVTRGAIFEPSWHPNGHTLVFVKREGGKRGIYTIEKDGTGEKKVSDDGDYMSPKFSPQVKK